MRDPGGKFERVWKTSEEWGPGGSEGDRAK